MTMYDEPVVADVPAVKPHAAGWPALVRLWFGLGWAIVAGLAWLTLTRWLDLDEPGRLVALAEGLTPFLYLPVWVVGTTALVGRRGALAAACAVLAVVHLVAVVPAMGSTARPAWASEAPSLTVLTTNAYIRNAEPLAAAGKILGADADVLVLIEVNGGLMRALEAQGIAERYPFNSAGRRDIRIRVFSRLPITDADTLWVPDNGFPTASISVGDTAVRVVGVHVSSAVHGADNWREQLDGLERFAAETDESFVITGDFNGTRWHPPFAALLEEGLTDAHEARGKGLSRSWPSGPFPLMRLDHVLVNDDVAVLDVRDVEIPGSDHLATLATLAVNAGGG